MEEKTMYSEFSSYCKCPFLWRNVFVNKNTVAKQLNYRDLVYKKDLSGVNTIGVEDQIIRADAVKQVIQELGDTFIFNGFEYRKLNFKPESLELKPSSDSEDVLVIPYPDIYDSSLGMAIVCTVITSTNIEPSNFNTLSHLQRIALNNNIKIIIRHIQTSALKMKKAETDEEFEARRAELIKKSKTGTSKAQKQMGETREEFFERYKKAITVNYFTELNNDNLVHKFEDAILTKLKCFFRDKKNPDFISFNDCYCKYCDINTKNGCPCLLGISSNTEQTGCVSVR